MHTGQRVTYWPDVDQNDLTTHLGMPLEAPHHGPKYNADLSLLGVTALHLP